eukprot:2418330-Rhodomonas_salina.1
MPCGTHLLVSVLPPIPAPTLVLASVPSSVLVQSASDALVQLHSRPYCAGTAVLGAVRAQGERGGHLRGLAVVVSHVGAR